MSAQRFVTITIDRKTGEPSAYRYRHRSALIVAYIGCVGFFWAASSPVILFEQNREQAARIQVLEAVAAQETPAKAVEAIATVPVAVPAPAALPAPAVLPAPPPPPAPSDFTVEKPLLSVAKNTVHLSLTVRRNANAAPAESGGAVAASLNLYDSKTGFIAHVASMPRQQFVDAAQLVAKGFAVVELSFPFPATTHFDALDGEVLVATETAPIKRIAVERLEVHDRHTGI